VSIFVVMPNVADQHKAVVSSDHQVRLFAISQATQKTTCEANKATAHIQKNPSKFYWVKPFMKTYKHSK